MTIKQGLAALDRDAYARVQSLILTRDVAHAAGLMVTEDNFKPWEDEAFNEYPLHVWYCTTDWVGYHALFFHDECVAVSQQIGRKYPKEYSWVSKEAHLKVFDYLKSIMIVPDGLELVDMNHEMQR